MGLAEYALRRTGNLSHGNAQRLGLAKALLHAPKLLLLDKPANGLDPAGIVEIRELLLELTREQGVTVFMSSHILAEVAQLAGKDSNHPQRAYDPGIEHGRTGAEMKAAAVVTARMLRPPTGR